MLKNYIGLYTLVRKEVSRSMRQLGQNIITPIITASLYIFVFGHVIGSSIDSIEGIKYISFVFPGVIAMNLIMSVFSATTFSVFFLKFQKTIEDMLTLPISYTELVVSLIISGIIRAFVICLAMALVAVMFGVGGVAHPFALLGYVLIVSILFGLIGVLSGIWADNSFEKFNLAISFILTPLTFLGGAFYSVKMLAANMQFIIYFNPVFYAIDGIRYSLTGYHDASLLLGFSVLGGLSLCALILCVYVFKTGWKLRS